MEINNIERCEKWIESTFTINAETREINFPINDYVTVNTPVDAFIDMFGTTIIDALDNDKEVIQALIDSDPDNTLGFNDIIIDYKK